MRSVSSGVLAIIADSWYIDTCIEEVGIRYGAHITHATDYSAFGAPLPGRSWYSTSKYRFTFNSQEADNELNQAITMAQYWEYDARLGRRWNMDPKPETSLSNYSCFSNSPISFADPHGDRIRFDSRKERRAFNQYQQHLTEMSLSTDEDIKQSAKNQLTAINNMMQSKTVFLFTSDISKIGQRTTGYEDCGVVVDQKRNRRNGRINVYIDLDNANNTNGSIAYGVTISNLTIQRDWSFFSIPGNRYSAPNGTLSDRNDLRSAYREQNLTNIDLKSMDANSSANAIGSALTKARNAPMDPNMTWDNKNWNNNVHGPNWVPRADNNELDNENYQRGEMHIERWSPGVADYTWGQTFENTNNRRGKAVKVLNGKNEYYYNNQRNKLNKP